MEFRRVIVETVGLMGKPNISDLFPALAWFDLQGIESRVKKLVLWFDRIFESLIAQRTQLDGADGGGKNKSKESKDFLQFMLELMHQGDDKTSVSITQLKALFMVYYYSLKTQHMGKGFVMSQENVSKKNHFQFCCHKKKNHSTIC